MMTRLFALFVVLLVSTLPLQAQALDWSDPMGNMGCLASKRACQSHGNYHHKKSLKPLLAAPCWMPGRKTVTGP